MERISSKTRTVFLINAASVLEKVDEQILPALYSRIGSSFNATPAQLGYITLGRAMMQALASPLGAVASQVMPRGHVIAAGCLTWATFTFLFSTTSSLFIAMPIAAMNGIGLALVIPNVQSLTADYYTTNARGKAFGALWLTISIGGMLGALYATNLGSLNPLGIEGWRFVFSSVAILSTVAGLLNYVYAHDPTWKQRPVIPIKSSSSMRSIANRQYNNNNSSTNIAQQQHDRTRSSGNGSPERQVVALRRQNGSSSSSSSLASALPTLDTTSTSTSTSDPSQQPVAVVPPSLDASSKSMVHSVLSDILSVMKIPTFSIIILQGIVGSVPYASLVFLTLYLQLAGMSDAHASILVALYLLGGGVGGLIGGYIGDAAAKRFPDHGRIAATQFSVFVGIPLAMLLFKGLPLSGDTAAAAAANDDMYGYIVVLHGAVIVVFALLTAWPAPCCNNPVFAEIVPPRQRNLVYAFDRCFEGAIAAFATPLVGVLAEKMFGFSGTSTVTGDREVDERNARALGHALLTFLTLPWLFCFVVYGGLHFTYPKDRKIALENSRMWEREGGGGGGGGGEDEEQGGGGGGGGENREERQRLLGDRGIERGRGGGGVVSLSDYPSSKKGSGR